MKNEEIMAKAQLMMEQAKTMMNITEDMIECCSPEENGDTTNIKNVFKKNMMDSEED